MDHTFSRVHEFVYSIIYDVLWIVEVVLFLRLLLKLFGVTGANIFVAFLYSAALSLMSPFMNILGNATTGSMVFEPSILIAMVFYAVVASLIVWLVRLTN